MKVKALVNFSGLVTMTKDEIKDIQDKSVCQDLLDAGYVQKVEKKQVKTDESK